MARAKPRFRTARGEVVERGDGAEREQPQALDPRRVANTVDVDQQLGLTALRDGRRPAAEDPGRPQLARSEEHTSELQSLAYLVCRLLLEKKKHETAERPVRCRPRAWHSPRPCPRE